MSPAREHHLDFTEDERQLILMALAHLAADRPGFDYALSHIAIRFDNQREDGRPELYEQFRALRSTRSW